jgi:5-methylcytosine-specific restriction endonuclease McrA
MPKGIPCSIPGCEASRVARGWCRKHYYRWKRTGTTDDPPPPPEGCSVEGCEAPHAAHGYCNKHAARYRIHGDPLGGDAFRSRNVGDCSVPGCPEPTRRNGLCNMHSQRVRATGNVGSVESRIDPAITAKNRALAGGGQKACSQCKRVLPTSSFYKDYRAPDGLRGDCKACRLVYDQQRYQKNGAAIRAYQAQYREAHREKARATTARYRAENPERVRAAMARWRADPKNRRVYREHQRRYRASKKSQVVGVITPELLDAKLAYWGWRCWMCGGSPTDWDHVKPLMKGGLHCLANLRPACGDCNKRKRDRWPFPDPGRRDVREHAGGKQLRKELTGGISPGTANQQTAR